MQVVRILEQTVRQLAGEIGERNLWTAYSNLVAAAEWIESEWTAMGYTVHRQTYTVEGRSCWNVEAVLPGTTSPWETVIVGAHYDTVPDTPGADDNASGVAVLMALAHRFRHTVCRRTVRFVAFVNEEPPFFQTPTMGSWVYAHACHTRGDRVIAMLSLESIGYFSDAPGSQRFPIDIPFRWFYSDRGNFIAFVSNLASRRLLRRVVHSFRRATDLPVERGALPAWIPGVDWSDQWAFWRHGYPAVMVTDTALYRNPAYHLPDDTPDSLDYTAMARVTQGLTAVIQDLANA